MESTPEAKRSKVDLGLEESDERRRGADPEDSSNDSDDSDVHSAEDLGSSSDGDVTYRPGRHLGDVSESSDDSDEDEDRVDNDSHPNTSGAEADGDAPDSDDDVGVAVGRLSRRAEAEMARELAGLQGDYVEGTPVEVVRWKAGGGTSDRQDLELGLRLPSGITAWRTLRALATNDEDAEIMAELTWSERADLEWPLTTLPEVAACLERYLKDDPVHWLQEEQRRADLVSTVHNLLLALYGSAYPAHVAHHAGRSLLPWLVCHTATDSVLDLLDNESWPHVAPACSSKSLMMLARLKIERLEPDRDADEPPIYGALAERLRRFKASALDPLIRAERWLLTLQLLLASIPPECQAMAAAEVYPQSVQGELDKLDAALVSGTDSAATVDY